MKSFGDDVPQYVLASFKDRLFALFLDVSILMLFSFPLSFLIAAAEALTVMLRGNKELDFPLVILFMSLRIISALGISVFYYGFFYKKRGTSLGKSILNLRIVCLPYSELPSYKTALLRDIFGKTLSILTFFAGYLMVIFRKDRKALHDLIADTVVLKRVR